jgi:two-component system sensor histidine kinase DesK
MTALRRTNIALHEARQGLADRAVADERDRIARDLHDVLGHSLSLIAIKSELAGRLLPRDPDGARIEIADVERVARESLASVRDTVSGARQPTLANELENARAVLEAAGIASTLDHRAGALAPADDAVLAWAVREAVTNVVRHSGARHAAIHTSRPMTTEAAIEVVDDGADGLAVAVVQGTDGTGLRGLRDRLEAVGGRLEAGPLAAGGYRLSATIPVHAAT